MEIVRNENQLVIKLTSDEVDRVASGSIIGDRGGLLPDSKVEVSPLFVREKDDSNQHRWNDNRLELASKMPLLTRIFPNQDLQICIPDLVLSDVRVTGRTIPLSAIELPDEAMREFLPQEGVRLEFGGSLKLINTPDSFYED